MSMKNSLIIILYDHPLEHTSDYAAQTCSYLSRNNTVIGFLSKDALSVKEILLRRQHFRRPKKVSPGYYLYQPLYILPFRRFKQAVRINLIINILAVRIYIYFRFFHAGFKNRYIWIFNPEENRILDYTGKTFKSVYDCVDYHGDKGGSSEEQKLIRSVDYFFVNSRTLYNLHKPVRKATVVPQGFRLEEFRKSLKSAVITVPGDKPVAGYTGGINYRLDFGLLNKLIAGNPQYNFIFIGPVQIYNRVQDRNYVRDQINIMFKHKNCIYFPE